MLLNCYNCDAQNPSAAKFCQNCGTNLIFENDETQNLKQELEVLKASFEAKIKQLDFRLEQLDLRLTVDENDLRLENPESEDIKADEKPVSEEPKINKPTIPEAPKTILGPKKEYRPLWPPQSQKESISQEPKKQSPKKPIPQQLPKPKKELDPRIANILEQVLSPLAAFWAYFQKTYQHYKVENKLPVFFMTLAGIVALLFGFGYLMQYSIVNYFGKISEEIKILFGFVCSSGIIFWAIRLYKKHEKYNEFASALLGLGIVLNYLFIYFLSDLGNTSPFLSSASFGFILILLNTAFAIFLALRFEARIIAVISLIGGAFAPFYLNSQSVSPLYYFYLWILSAAALYLAYRIRWRILGILTFITATAILELSVFQEINNFSIWIDVLIFHLFAYLFIYDSLFIGKQHKAKLEAKDIAILTGSVSLFIFNLFDVVSNDLILGLIYLANALPFLALFFRFRKVLLPEMKILFFLLAGTFVGFAIPALFHHSLMALFWAIEGLALVFCGFLFVLPNVRKEGFIFLGIAFFKIILIFPELNVFNEYGVSGLISDSFLNILVLGGIIFGLWKLLQKFQSINLNYEIQLQNVLKNALSFWFYFLVFTGLSYFFDDEIFIALMFLPSYLILFWGYKINQKISQYFAALTFVATFISGFGFILRFIWHDWGDDLFNEGFYFYLLIGGVLSSLYFLSIYFKTKSWISNLLLNVISLWATVLFWLVIAYYFEEFAFCFAPIPMFGLIYWGKIKSLGFAKILGFLQYLVLISGIVYSILWVSDYHFHSQTLWGKISAVEAFLSLWLFKWFYEKFFVQSKSISKLDVLRTLFYLILPLTILSPTKRLYPEFIPMVLWISALINFVLLEITKRKALYYELFALVGIASFAMISHLGIFEILAGFSFLSGILFYKKGFEYINEENNKFRIFFAYVFYFPAICINLFFNDLNNFQFILGFLFASAYLFALVILKNKILPIQKTINFAYRIAQVLTVFGIGFSLIFFSDISNFQGLVTIGIVLNLTLIGFLAYKKQEIQENQNQVLFWKIDVHLFHILLLCTYTLLIGLIVQDIYSGYLTIALVLHGIFLLFQSSKKKFAFLNRMMIAIFIFALLKLFFHDIADFELVEKIIVFVIIGVLLLGASFLYVKFRDKIS